MYDRADFLAIIFVKKAIKGKIELHFCETLFR